MHPLVVRQLRKAGLELATADDRLARFAAAVGDAYRTADEDRRQLEHSLDLASEELYERNRRLEAELEQRAALRQKLVDTAHYMEESERNYRAVFELSPVGILATDLATGRVLHANDAMLASTGYTLDELLARTTAGLVAPAHAGAERDLARTFERASRCGPLEKQYVRRDGSPFDALVSGIRTQDDAGRAIVWWIVQDISTRKAMELELADAARRDKLTGLATRIHFMEHLQRALARVRAGTQSLLAVLYLDFDRFKFVNDTLGHDAGDELLAQIAVRLRAATGARDGIDVTDGLGPVVSRFGGDEFLVLVNDLRRAPDAMRVADRLLEALAPVYDLRGREMHSSASIGVVTSDQCALDADEIVRNADVAMYEAKRSGRGRCLVFDRSMHTRLARRVAIEHALRRAVEARELRVVYQPIVELATGRMTSVEALLRWTHPMLGDIEPSEFVPIAEETGQIVALGHWVQAEACEAFKRWRAADPERAPETISVNVSRAELALGPRMLAQVQAVLERADLAPEHLQLEITEREIMRDPEAARTLLRALGALGVKIAMDDFGTGNSSLGFLRNYPFDTIKIDRSFVHDLTDSPDGLAVIHAAVNLIENLGMTSVVEGVEELPQVAVLQSIGCRAAQGWYFGRPVSADQLLESFTLRRPAALLRTA